MLYKIVNEVRNEPKKKILIRHTIEHKVSMDIYYEYILPKYKWKHIFFFPINPTPNGSICQKL